MIQGDLCDRLTWKWQKWDQDHDQQQWWELLKVGKHNVVSQLCDQRIRPRWTPPGRRLRCSVDLGADLGAGRKLGGLCALPWQELPLLYPGVRYQASERVFRLSPIFCSLILLEGRSRPQWWCWLEVMRTALQSWPASTLESMANRF